MNSQGLNFKIFTMKNKYLLFTLFFVQSLFGQQTPPNCPSNPSANTEEYCEEGKGISTNPEELQNPECPDLKNNFDWRAQTSSSTEWYPVIGPNGNQFNIQNPFTGPNDAFYFQYVSAQQGSNYNPENGWELLKVEFGTYGNIDANNIAGWHPHKPNGNEPKLPYMMLYNKYTGTLRFFGSLLDPHNTYKTIEIELRIPEKSPEALMPPNFNNTYQSNLKATNLLSIQGKSVQPLDQETDETAISVFVEYTNNPNNFFWFDVPVAYDPCICNNRVQLDVSFKFVQEADVNITGSLTGEIQTQNQGQGNYGLMVLNRILAAGISTAAAVKSGGAVINIKAFTDLIDIFKNHPNTSNQTSDNLDALQNVLECTSDWAHVMRDNKPFVPSSERQKWKAANDVIDAHTTFLSSLASGCNDKDNVATTITGMIEASGTVTQTDVISGTRINMALPGSKWNDFNLKFNDYADGSGRVVPSYPTYNERLGVFALLETPKVQLEDLVELREETFLSGTYNVVEKIVNKLHLKEELKYTFNPSLNIDNDKTIIECRYLVRKQEDNTGGNIYDIYPADLSQNPTPFLNRFSNHLPSSLHHPFISESIPINQFKNFEMIFSVAPKLAVNGNIILTYEGGRYKKLPKEMVFLQIKILLVSKDLRSDGLPNQSYHIYTYPVEIINTPTQTVDYNFFTENTFFNVNSSGIAAIGIDHDFYSLESNKFMLGGNGILDIDFTYNEYNTLFFNDIVEISAKLNTENH